MRVVYVPGAVQEVGAYVIGEGIPICFMWLVSCSNCQTCSNYHALTSNHVLTTTTCGLR